MSAAFSKLFLAEVEYLLASGWRQKNVGVVIESPQSVKDIAWEHPSKKGIPYGHENALRTQKETDLKPG